MGGGQVRKTHLLASGVDLVEETLFTAVGIPCNPHVSIENTAVAYTYVTNAKSGKVDGWRMPRNGSRRPIKVWPTASRSSRTGRRSWARTTLYRTGYWACGDGQRRKTGAGPALSVAKALAVRALLFVRCAYAHRGV